MMIYYIVTMNMEDNMDIYVYSRKSTYIADLRYFKRQSGVSVWDNGTVKNGGAIKLR